jgi:hypothetical protein
VWRLEPAERDEFAAWLEQVIEDTVVSDNWRAAAFSMALQYCPHDVEWLLRLWRSVGKWECSRYWPSFDEDGGKVAKVVRGLVVSELPDGVDLAAWLIGRGRGAGDGTYAMDLSGQVCARLEDSGLSVREFAGLLETLVSLPISPAEGRLWMNAAMWDRASTGGSSSLNLSVEFRRQN